MGTREPTGHDAAPRGHLLPLRLAVVVKLFALGAAILTSSILFIDYRNAGDPAFCGVASGCFAVRVSAYSHVGGIPLPHLALPVFLLLFAGALVARTVEQHRIVAAAAGLGGLVAIALVALQAFVIGALCPWCMVVDVSTLVAAAAAIAIAIQVGASEARAREASLRPSARLAWAVCAALAAGLPFVWARYPVVPPAPPEIAAEQVPGKVTIVSFTDFECPFCRKLHPILDELRERHAADVRFVRKMKPLSGHPGAMPAAKAYVCTPEPHKDAAASALYAMESADLTEKKLVALADRLGLDRKAFAECLEAEATAEAIRRDAAQFEALGGRGLPFTWVNARVILGADRERLVETLSSELAGRRTELPLAALFAVLGAAFLLAAVLAWPPPPPAEAAGPAGG